MTKDDLITNLGVIAKSGSKVSIKYGKQIVSCLRTIFVKRHKWYKYSIPITSLGLDLHLNEIWKKCLYPPPTQNPELIFFYFMAMNKFMVMNKFATKYV